MTCCAKTRIRRWDNSEWRWYTLETNCKRLATAVLEVDGHPFCLCDVHLWELDTVGLSNRAGVRVYAIDVAGNEIKSPEADPERREVTRERA